METGASVTYDIKVHSTKNEHLNALEDVCSIKFIEMSSKFQSNLSKDIKVINKDPVLFITAEKRFLSAFKKNY